MTRSHYAILGVRADASPEDIRSSYRRLVKEYHPDHYRGGSDAFCKIQDAYGVLSDERRRNRYDQQLRWVPDPRPHGISRSAGPEPLIPEPGHGVFGGISHARSIHHAAPSPEDLFDWLWRQFSDF